MELIIDKDRLQDIVDGKLNQTGILVRATNDGEIGNYDIVALTKDSLLEWLRSRDDNPDTGASWREQVIMIVFGHTI